MSNPKKKRKQPKRRKAQRERRQRVTLVSFVRPDIHAEIRHITECA
jgi:hypothetical protein